MCVCVCVCVRERAFAREGKTGVVFIEGKVIQFCSVEAPTLTKKSFFCFLKNLMKRDC